VEQSLSPRSQSEASCESTVTPALNDAKALLAMADATDCRIGHDDNVRAAGRRQGFAAPDCVRP